MDEQKAYLRICDFIILLHFHHSIFSIKPKTHLKETILFVLKDFIMSKKPNKTDFVIHVRDRGGLEVLVERKNYMRYYVKKRQVITTYYDISVFIFLVILRDILQILISRDNGFMFHASSILINNKAILFTGSPGAGKTTAKELLSTTFMKLSDDTIYILKKKKKYYIYQTQYLENDWTIHKSPKKYPLEKVFFLRKSKNFKIEKMVNKEYIIKRMLKQVWMDNDSMTQQTQYVMNFVSRFNNFATLYFAKDSDKLVQLLKAYGSK